MTEVAGAGIDDDQGWSERLAWAYGLTAPDPAERAAALVRLAGARREADAALLRVHRASQPSRWLRRKARDWAAADKAYGEAASRSLPQALWSKPYSQEISTWPGLPFALLYLEWEVRYPREWTRHAKAWGTKQTLIREVATAGHDHRSRAKLIDLVGLVVERSYRCKDREYVRVARAVDGDELRDRLRRAHRSENPTARLHAGYVLWLLDRPEIPNTRHVWRTWLAGTLT
ncbi:hypothetical protein [Streptomyces sp. NBC_00827]|uniref:hypothetical protein n=1 Tax=Streptomyces sp. NBC_00827 TaxID=2903677 RepID=UPI0038669822|nr:hypothetical protein OG569_17740 [Streptomyces sp. NBC_00827]